MRLATSFFGLYVIAGLVVAAVEDYLEDLGSLNALLEAALAVVLWPLVLLGIDIDVN